MHPGLAPRCPLPWAGVRARGNPLEPAQLVGNRLTIHSWANGEEEHRPAAKSAPKSAEHPFSDGTRILWASISLPAALGAGKGEGQNARAGETGVVMAAFPFRVTTGTHWTRTSLPAALEGGEGEGQSA